MPIQGGPHDEGLDRNDIEAALETRRELGLRYDAELVDGFADRIERAVSSGSPTSSTAADARTRPSAAAGPRQLALAIVSLVAVHPDLASRWRVKGEFVPLFVTLFAIVAVNVAHAWQSKR